MKFSTRTEEELTIGLTPLIDVVFILLIFFMVTTTFDRSSELRIDLPEAGAQASKDKSKKLEIAIDSKGQYYINQVKVNGTSRKVLYLAMQKVMGGNKNLPVIIKADALAAHQSVINAMDAAGRLGLNRLSIATSFKE
ncbi:MAG TPA: biopolymer transporter ExbD [Gammaproteobacteria bacterium]|nr:biopolymer transporter ExbD [Gammaproteobacteria bacterium]